MQKFLDELKKRDKEIKLLEHTQALLSWDQETYMPKRAVQNRAEQISFLHGMMHRKSTGPRIGELLDKLGANEYHPAGNEGLSAREKAYVREMFRQYSRNKKIPNALVEKLARTTSIAKSVWAEAKQNDSFQQFAPHLRDIVNLVKEIAECLGYREHPYDALLDEYEPWIKTSEVKQVFQDLERDLVPLVQGIAESEQVDDGFLQGTYPIDKQREINISILRKMGYDFVRGRLDISEHPFTTRLGFHDVRITTRYNEYEPKTSIFGTIHECGHALYEMGIDETLQGTVLSDGTSHGIHESQSRLWENMLGRSFAFWAYFFPEMQELFPNQLKSVSLEQFYRAINKVSPTHIRIEADEVTYSLHIILRFHIECALMAGEINVDEIPLVWRERSEQLLGIRPEKDSEGPLQDVHWSFGGIGYFPTYALGNLYAAQFYGKMESEIGDVSGLLRKGNFQIVLNWLRDNIHRFGKQKTAKELIQNVTGEPLKADYFMDYLREKYSKIYEL